MNRLAGNSEHESVGRDMEEALREFGTPVMPVDRPEVLLARRNRTVSHLRALQARAVVRGQDARLWRRRLLIAALLLFPTGALAATWAVLRESSDRGVTRSGEAAPRSAPVSQAALRVSAGSSPASVPARSGSETAGDPPSQASAVWALGASLSAASPAFAGPARRTSSSPAPTTGGRTAEPASSGPRVASFKSFPDGALQAKETSTLAAENALMQSAMSLARAGDDSRAILRFSDFLARYPRSPLAENASVERLRALARLRAERASSGAAFGDVPHQ
jgi:hypothetical protein